MTFITPEFYGPRRLVITDDTNTQGYDITAVVEPQGGRLVITSLRFNQRPSGPPIQRAAVGKIPIDNFLRKAGDRVFMQISEDESNDFPEAVNTPHPDGSTMLAITNRSVLRLAWTPQNNPPTTDEDYRRIARIYRWCRIVGNPPTAAMSELLGKSTATVRRWTAKAESLGYLTPEERAH